MDINAYLKAPLKKTKSQVSQQSRPCFLGAWYYKVYSSLDQYLGIEAIITLPEFQPDEDRFVIKNETFYPGRSDLTFKQYLDTPSIYLGGKGDYESDVGLGWFRGVTDSNKKTISDEKITFRPFWRYIYVNEKNEEINTYEGTPINDVEHYYFPGDKLKIMVISPKENYLMMVIEVIETTKIPKYRQIRAKYQLNDNKPSNLITPMFPSPGHGVKDVEYKRVNAIDQYSNEGKPAFNTNAKVSPMTWHEVNLFKKENDQIVKYAFDDNLIAQRMLCPYPFAYTIVRNNNNEEIVVINPGKKEE